MAILGLASLQEPEQSSVTLAAYARHIQACECAFFGVVNAPACTYHSGCRTLWTKEQRDWVQYYLAEAQHEIEEVIHYFIGPRWVVNEEHPYSRTLLTRWGYVISGGVAVDEALAAGATVDYTDEPATIGPLATTVTDVNEVHFYHADSDIEIIPSAVEIAAGMLTAAIPRCRLVLPELADNPTAGLEYADLDNFAEEVDVIRRYNDATNPATLVYPACTGCTEREATTCLQVTAPEIGAVRLGSVSGTPYKVRLSYYAGREFTDSHGRLTRWGLQAQTAIIRLAHAKMPHAPCACDAADELWKRDREVIVDGFGRPRRGISPFGPEEGAWAAYAFCAAPGMELVRGGTL